MIRIDSGVRALNTLFAGPGSRTPRHLPTQHGRRWPTSRPRSSARLERRLEVPGVLPSPSPPPSPRPRSGSYRRPAALGAKRAQVMQAALDRELALVRTTATLKNNAEKRATQEGVKDVRAYSRSGGRSPTRPSPGRPRSWRRSGGYSRDTDPQRKAEEEGKIEDAPAKARLEREEEIASLTAEERDAVRELGQERLALRRASSEAQGRRLEAALAGIDEEIHKDRTICCSGSRASPDAEREAELARLRASLEAGRPV